MYINLSGYRIFSQTKQFLLKKISNHINDFNGGKINIISGNPEVLFNGLNLKELDNLFRRDESIIIPDGVGVVITSKLIGRSVKEKIAGIEVMDEILNILNGKNGKVYFLGSTEEIIYNAVCNIGQKYKKLEICGYHHGYFNDTELNNILYEIKESNPIAIFIALGSPKQEEFIQKYMDELPCRIFMGVGGSFDIYSGKNRRAPRFMINIGFEWAYRVFKEPYRIKRLYSIPKFMLKSIKYHFRGEG